LAGGQRHEGTKGKALPKPGVRLGDGAIVSHGRFTNFSALSESFASSANEAGMRKRWGYSSELSRS
jgi:hypothetical protein